MQPVTGWFGGLALIQEWDRCEGNPGEMHMILTPQ